jgi:hypothetical protein
MPSTSKTQQRLMGVAYAVKKGDMELSEVDAEYRDKVQELVSSMTLKQLKDFASTSHEGLPDRVEEYAGADAGIATTPNSITGAGAVLLPDMVTGIFGSGDVPAGQKEEDDEELKKIRRYVLSMQDFMDRKTM